MEITYRDLHPTDIVNYKNEFYKIVSINVDWLLLEGGVTAKFNEISFVPLTHDILLKIGYMFTENRFSGDKYDFEGNRNLKIDVDSDGTFYNRPYAMSKKDNVLYLHELQQLDKKSELNTDNLFVESF